MERCWFVLIRKEKKGPFSVNELRAMAEITPDTLAWKEGFLSWRPIREIPELKELFEESVSQEESEEGIKAKISSQEDAVISLDFSEPPFRLWLLFCLLVLIYVIVQLYYNVS